MLMDVPCDDICDYCLLLEHVGVRLKDLEHDASLSNDKKSIRTYVYVM